MCFSQLIITGHFPGGGATGSFASEDWDLVLLGAAAGVRLVPAGSSRYTWRIPRDRHDGAAERRPVSC